MNYYNENNKFAATWLQDLINRKVIPFGHVDTRSIEDVQPEELEGYTQCHFFAGIGGWSEALRLANFTGEIWTGSVPCQPFSQVGRKKGSNDERHLWPEFRRLIESRKPQLVIGEQVSSPLGELWVDDVSFEMEEMQYTFGHTILGAGSVGSFHLRKRIFWIGIADSLRVGRSGQSKAHSPRKLRQRWKGCEEDLLEMYKDPLSRNSRIGPSLFHPGNDGIPWPVEQLQGFGNAICPQIAAEFILVIQEILNPKLC